VKIQLSLFHPLRLMAVGLMLMACFTFALADTIKLKNGSVIKGKVVGYSQGEFTVILDLGTSSRKSSTRMIIAAEDIEAIEFDGSTGSSVSMSADPPRDSSTLRRPNTPANQPSREPVRESEPPPVTERETSAPPRSTPEGNTSAPPSEKPSGTSLLPLIAEKETRVAAAADWTNSSLRVQKGQRIVISATGEVDLGKGKRTGPGGIELADPGKLLEDRPTGALIAVIGDDNNDFILIGRQIEFTAQHTGFLYLSVNERDLKDNGGSYVARIKVLGNK
jgi:hypothetical protein